MIRKGPLGGKLDIFAASGESTAWVLLWKTRSRQIAVRVVCLVAQFNFFKTAFDPRKWTLILFGKESLGRQPQLITPENEGGDNTNYPSPANVTFSADLEIPFDKVHNIRHLLSLISLQDSQVSLVYRQDGLQLHHQQVVEKELKQEIPRVSGYSPSATFTAEPQLIPVGMSDGEDDDDQPPQGEAKTPV